MNLTFRNRISLFYLLATALMMALVYSLIFFIVKGTLYHHLDDDLTFEASKHVNEVNVTPEGHISFLYKEELEEREHREAEVNPVFVQVINKSGQFMDKTPNLKEQELLFLESRVSGIPFDANLNTRIIRQVQVPIKKNGEIQGYILAAMSQETVKMVIQNLRHVLLLSYPLLLIALFFVSRYLAGKNILPIKNITETTNRITKNNFNERVRLPIHQDELYALSSSINSLLGRIETAIQRERQFTSDASHELRTPLSSLRGTLEVLIRRPRSQAEYEQKIKYSLTEIDRMTALLEQLLLLARFDASQGAGNNPPASLISLIDEVLSRYSKEILQKKMKVHVQSCSSEKAEVPRYYANLVLDNIIQNAIKYSACESHLYISIGLEGERIICTVKDEGIGIRKEDLGQLYQPLFRSGALEHKHIGGSGLGLSIAQKAAAAIQAELAVASELGQGTTFTIVFKQILSKA